MPLMPMPSAMVMDNDSHTKQAPSPYITFCTVKRVEVKSIFPEMSFSDMGRILGQLWAAMGDDGRAVRPYPCYLMKLFSGLFGRTVFGYLVTLPK